MYGIRWTSGQLVLPATMLLKDVSAIQEEQRWVSSLVNMVHVLTTHLSGMICHPWASTCSDQPIYQISSLHLHPVWRYETIQNVENCVVSRSLGSIKVTKKCHSIKRTSFYWHSIVTMSLSCTAFTARRYASAVYAVIVSVRLSVTCRYCTRRSKHRSGVTFSGAAKLRQKG